jgi:hypothetical protein
MAPRQMDVGLVLRLAILMPQLVEAVSAARSAVAHKSHKVNRACRKTHLPSSPKR